jgi:hypothetical protein
MRRLNGTFGQPHRRRSPRLGLALCLFLPAGAKTAHHQEQNVQIHNLGHFDANRMAPNSPNTVSMLP